MQVPATSGNNHDKYETPWNSKGFRGFESALTNFLNVPYKSDCLGLKSHETPFSRIV